MSSKKSNQLRFKPRARLLLLLGDQLIRDAGIAVFELVKNAFDADSKEVRITMEKLTDDSHARIIIEDSGTGMDFKKVTEVWLSPGTDYRAQAREQGLRTKRFGRLPLGEKGVGRFAAHKLGRRIEMVTRSSACQEVVVQIDWSDFEKHKFLDQVPVQVYERKPTHFRGKATGTRIEISDLREPWNRMMVRDLHRAVNSICSPFERKVDFFVKFILPDQPEWLKGVLSSKDLLEYSLFRAKCDIKGKSLSYVYRFTPYPGLDRVKPRIAVHAGKKSMSVTSDEMMHELLTKEVGPIRLDLYIFDLEPRLLALGVPDKKGLKDYLRDSGGIRVYREGIRVYDYGERGNDWLNLGGQRVNVPTKRISNNLVLGAVTLNLGKSKGLIEKTNREGFVDSPAYRAFWHAVDFTVTQIELERNIDKKRLREAYSSKTLHEPVIDDLGELRTLVERKGLVRDLGPYLDRIETDFVVIRDRFLASASAGLSLASVIHEVEKGVEELTLAVKETKTNKRIQTLAEHIARLVEGFAALLRRSGKSNEKASSMVKQALYNTELRLRAHDVEVLTDLQDSDFTVYCSRRLVISTIMNLIDNSIWWLDNKWGNAKSGKVLYIGLRTDDSGVNSIVVGDNGPGFQDSPDVLVEPFISRKPDGMGLGLHLADQVMKAHGGSMTFPECQGGLVPKSVGGAIVALNFVGGVS